MSAEEKEEFNRTIHFGETAIGHLKANNMPAYPRNYELWYTYVSGLNPALNRAINDLLKEQGKITLGETDRIYDEHLSPQRYTDQMEEIGGRLSNHLAGMLSMLNNAADETTAYSKSLATATSSMSSAGADSEKLKYTIEQLFQETQKMEKRNQDLETSLNVSKTKIEELQVNLETIKHESLTDPLTSLANRKLFDQSMMRVMEDCEGGAKSYSLLMIDIDYFKKFNDTYGHQTGDQVLRLVASVLKQSIKGQDIAARFGGEEFSVILPQTQLSHAARVADNIREAIMGKELIKRSSNERLGRVTVSIGVATWIEGDTVQTIIERADSALYHAKRTGRNRVCSEADLAKSATAVA